MVEVEAYRRTAERALGRRIAEVVAPDDWYLKRGLTAPALQSALTGRRLTAARRRARPRRGPVGTGRARAAAGGTGRSARPQRRAAQGAADGPGPPGRRRQPHRRRDAVAGRLVAAAAGELAHARRAAPAAPPSQGDGRRLPRTGRLAHGPADARTPAGRRPPPRR